ncbi:MAG TPA: GGDEF domain-containing protein [Caulobacteraceae bacterium]|nr:GGDEF domain-containing protein [Caulobacteraceae bacterium]
MKISRAASQPYAPIGRAGAGARAVLVAPAADQASFLGIAEAELTPAVRGALATLMLELDDLRVEVRRLKARLLEAEAAADADPLTGLANRRAFLHELARAAALRQRYGAPAALVYFDLDDFKAVNDRFGHAAGDAALRAVAGRLSAQVRDSDAVGRLGGDEFAVLLRQSDLAAADAKAAALARAIAGEPFSLGEWLAPLKASYGVAEVDPALEPEALLALADAAMFAMKRARIQQA